LSNIADHNSNQPSTITQLRLIYIQGYTW